MHTYVPDVNESSSNKAHLSEDSISETVIVCVESSESGAVGDDGGKSAAVFQFVV